MVSIFAMSAVWYLDLQLLVLSVSITTKVGSLNLTHGEVCSIQHHVISLSVSCDRSVVSSTNKTDSHAITEILLKVALTPSITLTLKIVAYLLKIILTTN
jgi:hypothetical protein